MGGVSREKELILRGIPAAPGIITGKALLLDREQYVIPKRSLKDDQIANKFDSDIIVSKGKAKVNGKSIMGIMMLEAGRGSKVTITTKGEDAQQAITELENLLLSDIEDIIK